MKSIFEKLIIDVRAKDLNRAVEFYKNILGLPLIQKESDWASFEVSGAEIHLYVYGGAENGVEFRVSDIEKAVETLQKKGVEFHVEKNRPNLLNISGVVMEFTWGKSAHFKDSEGNHLALIEDVNSKL